MSADADGYQRDQGRERSPRRRSRSPRRARRSYSPRSRSRSRDDYRRNDRRTRSPMSGAQAPGGGYPSGQYGTGRGAPARSTEERAVAKDSMLQNIRESSQQDRRVYVGNLSYDVKWHHLKDFMRQGSLTTCPLLCWITTDWVIQPERSCLQMYCCFRMECLRWAKKLAELFGHGLTDGVLPFSL